MKKLGLIAVVTFVAACSSSSTTTPTDAGGGQDAAPDVPSNTFTQSGKIVDFDSNKGLKGVTVTAKTATDTFTATTDDTGKYALAVPKNTPYTMSLTADKYLKLNEQEWSLTGDADRGSTKFVSAGTQSLLQALLTGYDNTLAVVSLGFIKLPSCTASLDGMTITLTTPDKAQVKYFNGGFPNGSAVSEGASPAVLVYNFTPGAEMKFTLANTTCKLAAFPQTDPTAPTISYSGKVTSEAGQSASFIRFFLE
jgi:hypothetical protein